MVSKKHGIEDLEQFATDAIRRAGEKALSYYGKGDPGVKFDEGRVMIAYGCPICLVKKFEEEDEDEQEL